MPEKLDLKKKLKAFYTSSKDPSIVDVPKGSFLTYSGRGEPGGKDYIDSIAALYTVVYTIKFQSKAKGNDFTVMPLEGLWWFDDPKGTFLDVPREEWNWRSMIRVPDFIAAKQVDVAKAEAREKKGLATVDAVTLEQFAEGLSAQVMHIGPYSEEGPTVERLHKFIQAEGYRPQGKHHEIYLSDPGRTAPEKLKTIVRQPIHR